jgi:hypothetical protein
MLFIWVYEYEENIKAFGRSAAGVVAMRSTRCKMIENIPTPLVSFARKWCCRIFHGDDSEKSPEIHRNNYRLIS